MKRLARAIFDASPTTADDLIEAIDHYRVMLKIVEQQGLYDADVHPDNPVHREADAERLQRLEVLRSELEAIRYRHGSRGT